MEAMEDNFADVVSKAQRGLGISNEALAARAGVSTAAIAAVRREEYDALTLQKIAPVLGLNARALVELPDYRPEPLSLPGLKVFTTSYGGMRVNAYLAEDGGCAALFDTGTDAAPILDYLRSRSLKLCGIFVTHAHGDHVAELAALCRATGAPAWVCEREPLGDLEAIDTVRTFTPGQVFECGRLRIEARSTWGHTRGGSTYAVSGLAQPVAAVGDALFAGSMGGAGASYADALRTNREAIFTLPPDTILCPGHGPLTTVANERAHNPFFA